VPDRMERKKANPLLFYPVIWAPWGRRKEVEPSDLGKRRKRLIASYCTARHGKEKGGEKGRAKHSGLGDEEKEKECLMPSFLTLTTKNGEGGR